MITSLLLEVCYDCSTKGKGEKTECSNYRGTISLSLVGKIYARVLLERVREVTEGLMDDEQKGFRAGRGCVDQIFFLKQIGEKARVCGFYALGEDV